MARNFYGALRVNQDGNPGDADATRTLVHGTITHGLQFLAPERRRFATTYYGRQSGVGLAILNTRHSAQRVGVIGLGTATMASYGRPGDYYRFYEINPLVVEIARKQFTYLLGLPGPSRRSAWGRAAVAGARAEPAVRCARGGRFLERFDSRPSADAGSLPPVLPSSAPGRSAGRARQQHAPEIGAGRGSSWRRRSGKALS